MIVIVIIVPLLMSNDSGRVDGQEADKKSSKQDFYSSFASQIYFQAHVTYFLVIIDHVASLIGV